MKKSVDILGLPVISISEGNEIGAAKALVINPVQGAVAAVVVDDGKWYLGAKLLPFASIAGLGEYALTVESGKAIVAVADAPELEKLLVAEVKVIGAKVLTKAGRIDGKVSELIIDETGKIVSCEIENNNGDVVQLPASRVLTYGKDVMIVLDADAPNQAPEPKTAPAAEVPAVPASAPKAAPADSEAANDESGKKFEDKQRKYLLGKKAAKRIETDSGVIIVEAGGDITEEVIQKAKLAGKFVELSMSI